MSSSEVFYTVYRVILDDGRIWIESRDVQEAVEKSVGKTYTINTLTVRLETGNWEPMTQSVVETLRQVYEKK